MRRTVFAALCLFMIVAPTVFGGVALTKVSKVKVNNVGGKVDFCNICVQIMGQIINELLNIILNIGVVGSCGELCHYLPNKYEADACDLICDYVGIEEFIKLIEYEDPDPIFFCDEAKICPVTTNGSAYSNNAWVQPTSGPAGTKFMIGYNYTVTSKTSTGGPNVAVMPPSGMPFGGAEFDEGENPGTYIVTFQLDTTPSEQEPFSPGIYNVSVALCAGDCSGRHKWSGVYCDDATSFTITE
jgi:hypothetical protein